MTIRDLLDLPPTISVEQAGRILGVSRGVVYQAARDGDIPVIRVGRRLAVPSGQLLALLGIDHIAESVRELHRLLEDATS